MKNAFVWVKWRRLAQPIWDCGDKSPLWNSTTCRRVSKRGHARALQNILQSILWIFILHSSFCFRASAQTYTLNWNVIADGGGTVATNPYTLSGTIGQADASPTVTSGPYALTGGYWSQFAPFLPNPSQSNIWINPLGGSWLTTGNWVNGKEAQGSGILADFSELALNGNITNTLDGGVTIGSLIIGDQNGAYNWTLSAGQGGPLTLTGGAPSINVINQTATIGVSLGGSQGFTKNGPGLLVVVQPLPAAGYHTNNAGVLRLLGSLSTYANSGLVINDGAVESAATLSLMVSQNANTGSTNVLGAGTLRLIATTDGPANPDLNFGPDANGVLYYGAQIDMATLDLGATQRYLYATSSHNSVAIYRNREDARINGNIIGIGGITYIAQNNNAGANGNQPMECPLVLAGSNTFAGELEIQRGSVYLLNPKALTQTNQLLLDPIAGHNSKFFLYGNNPLVANLASSGAGNTLIANGNVANNTAPIPAATLTVVQTVNTIFAGQLVDTNYEYDAYTAPLYTSGSLGLAKTGPATLNLTGASTYTGPTTISAGTLAVNGSLASPVTVSAGATLAGTGSLTGPVIVNGTNSPGNGSVGTLTTGPETWNPAGCQVFTLTNASTSGGTSLLNINGTLNVAATAANPFVIHLASLTAAQIPGAAGGFNPAATYTWPLATATSGFTGFAASSFAVDTSGFANSFKGVFTVTTSGNTLDLNYGEPVAAPPGLVAWWPANGNALDVVGSNNGTLTNGATYGTGEVGQSFKINSNHAGVFIGNPTALQLQNFTIEAWVQRGTLAKVSNDPNANGGAAALFYYGSQGYGMGMHTDGTISLTKIDVNDVNDGAEGARVTDLAWHHVAVTKSGTSVSFYIDGVAYPSVSYSSAFQFTTPAAIGVRGDLINANNNDSFAGSIDELAIYDRALTPAEIQSIYAAGAAGKVVPPATPVAAPASLVAWWPANGNAVDVVGGNNGTLTNAATYVPGEVQQAFNFNGSSAEVLLANTAALQLQNFTIETWLQRGSATSVTLDGSAVAGNALFFGYGHSGYSLGMSPTGNPLLTWVDHNDVVCSAAISDTDWHHVAVTTTNGTVVFYIDGTAYPVTGTYNPGYVFATAPALGGRADNINEPNNDSFLGSLDELSVYNAALTPAQILAIYTAGAAGKYLTTSASIVVGPITNPQTGHSYAILAPGTWTEAQAEAHALGGHLATIRSLTENNWITNNLLVNFQPSGGPNLSHLPLWIGLYDPTIKDGAGSQHAADFIWDSGESYSYRNWNSGEPNNTGNAEYYTAINWDYAAGYSSTPGTWNDTPLNGSTGYAGTSSGPYYGLVEFGAGVPPIPTVPGAFYGPVTSPLNGHEYYIVPPNNWSNAQTAAIALGGNLVTIRSAAEDAWIVNNMLADLSIYGGPDLATLPLWIGLYDPERNDGAGPGSAHAANFIWVSGEPSTYRNWNASTSEPNNQNNDEYFGTINWQFAQGTTTDHTVWDDTPFAGTSGQAGTTDGPYYGIAEVGATLGTPPSPVITSSGPNLTIAWPATGTYSVQQTTNLVTPGSWVPSTFAITSLNGTNSITFTPPATGNLFFRLSNP